MMGRVLIALVAVWAGVHQAPAGRITPGGVELAETAGVPPRRPLLLGAT